MDRPGGRDRDRAELPEPMRRDVRLLGDLLGEVIRDSDPKTGPDLLADVERLRYAVIEARRGPQDSRDDPAGDHIGELARGGMRIRFRHGGGVRHGINLTGPSYRRITLAP